MTQQVPSAAAPGPTSGTTELPTGLVRATPAFEGEVEQFQLAAYPHRRPEWLLPRWRWMFFASAARLGREPLVRVFRKSSGVVAHQGVLPVEMQLDGVRLPTGWFVETMVLEPFRAGAIGPGVIAKTKEDLPFTLSLGQTPEMRAIQFRLGWVQVAPLEMLVLPVEPTRLLVGKIRPAVAARLAGWALAARTAWHRWRSRPARGLTVRPVARFGPEHDRLWHQVSGNYPCAVVRDASFLNWKFVDQPFQDFVRLEFHRGEELVGVMVLRVDEPDHRYPYRRVLICDLVFPAYDRRLAWAAFDAAHGLARRRRAAAVVLSVVNRPWEQRAVDYGFLRRDPIKFFLVCPEGLDDDARRRVLDPANWLLTLADSDIDRPEVRGEDH